LGQKARLFFYRKVEHMRARLTGAVKNCFSGEEFGRRKISTQRWRSFPGVRGEELGKRGGWTEMGVADRLVVYASILFGGRVAWAGTADVFVGAAGWLACGCGVYQS
jgi:hypothetical protein